MTEGPKERDFFASLSRFLVRSFTASPLARRRTGCYTEVCRFSDISSSHSVSEFFSEYHHEGRSKRRTRPVGGGDTIPLLRPIMTLGRRESCDVPLQFPNISGVHCELSFRDGYWSIKDLNSTNGVKVNGMRVQARPLKPGDEIAIAKRRFTIQYVLTPEAQHELEALADRGRKHLRQIAAGEGRPVHGNPVVDRQGGRPGDRSSERWQGERIELTELDE